jgi:hypothetical protein
MGEGTPGRGPGVFGYFGLETREKFTEVLLWTLPYLGMLVLGLGGLSWLVQKLTPISFWVYAVAMSLAILYFFFFLARVRQMGVEAQHSSDAPRDAK